MAQRILALLLFLYGLAVAQPAPISYTVRFPAPRTHYVEVEARFPTAGQARVELMMAVWTPYVIREYAKNLEDVTARTADGHVLAIEKSRKNRWLVETGGADPVVVSYRVYCHVMGVQDNWVDDEFALLNGAPTFLTLAEHAARPHDVQSSCRPAGRPPPPVCRPCPASRTITVRPITKRWSIRP